MNDINPHDLFPKRSKFHDFSNGSAHAAVYCFHRFHDFGPDSIRATSALC